MLLLFAVVYRYNAVNTIDACHGTLEKLQLYYFFTVRCPGEGALQLDDVCRQHLDATKPITTGHWR